MASITQLGFLGPRESYSPYPMAGKTTDASSVGTIVASTTLAGVTNSDKAAAGTILALTALSGTPAADKTAVGTILSTVSVLGRWSDPLSAGSLGLSSGITGGEVDDF
jgi:hypothetical protein